VDKLTDTYDLVNLNKEYVNNLNRSIISSVTETVIKILPTKTQDQTDSLLNSTGPLKS
jgi:hypothetical protein